MNFNEIPVGDEQEQSLDEITPGQWHYEDGQVKDDRGEIVARAYREAECKISPYQRDNNMRFISVAPDMYEALRFIQEEIKVQTPMLGVPNHNPFVDMSQFVEQALAKAEGRL